MAVALDASTPGRFTGTPVSAGTVTSAAFTAPTDAFMVLTLQMDGGSAGVAQGTLTISVTDSGGLTWSERVRRDWAETTAGGMSAIFTARTTSNVSRTVTITPSWTTNTGTATRTSAVCYVWSGADVNGTPFDTVGANNEGGSLTNSINTTSLTPGANGVLVVSANEWSASGACTSSDLKGIDSVVGTSHAEYAGAIDVIDGWKVCTSGVGVTGNLDGFGAGATQWKWCQLIVREAAGATTKSPVIYSTFSRPRIFPSRKY